MNELAIGAANCSMTCTIVLGTFRGTSAIGREGPSLSGVSRRSTIRTARFWVIVAALLSISPPVHAYVGPGAGFVFLSSFLAVAAAFGLAVLVALLGFLRLILRLFKTHRSVRPRRKVVVLGFDGMDPRLTEQMMAAGDLPNLQQLAASGTYRRLATTCPALSPVAWSSFATGTDPSRHGIFDFLTRDPRTYSPVLSSVRTTPPRRSITLRNTVLPLSSGSVELQRKSRAWWKVLGEQGVFCSVLRVPITYPAEKLFGVMLSGMCVPDLLGTQGTFSLYTSVTAGGRDVEDGRVVPLAKQNGKYISLIEGPPNPFSRNLQPLTIPFSLVVADGGQQACLSIQGQTIALQAGEWSDWVPLWFGNRVGPRIHGICKFYLKQTSPDIELYQSPLHIDPEAPALPISYPSLYAPYLAKLSGPFATLGLAEDTSALEAGALTDNAFLKQAFEFHEERERIFETALRDTRDGVCVAVFDTTDRIQHMFWNTLDEEGNNHPVKEAYRLMDQLVGRVASRLAPQDVLIVLSDHGFVRFERGVNLNTWLLEQGYLVLRDGESSGEWLAGIDWTRTRAYAIGLAGIFLNLRGRESQGIVDPREEAPALRAEIAQQLRALRDLENGGCEVVQEVVEARSVYRGPYVDLAPDLLVGYAPGYRVSWEAAKGKAGPRVIEPNLRHWAGDHCVASSLVPGVLFSNHRITVENPGIIDIGPSILALFGVRAPDYMQGRNLFSTEPVEMNDAEAEREAARVESNTA